MFDFKYIDKKVALEGWKSHHPLPKRFTCSLHLHFCFLPPEQPLLVQAHPASDEISLDLASGCPNLGGDYSLSHAYYGHKQCFLYCWPQQCC